MFETASSINPTDKQPDTGFAYENIQATCEDHNHHHNTCFHYSEIIFSIILIDADMA